MELKKIILRDLRNSIANGTLRPGERITEPLICHQYGIGRTRAREVLKGLEREGLVIISPNLGARVINLSFKDMSDLYAMVIVLEGAAARFACEAISDQEIKRLEECQFLLEKAIAEHNFDLTFELNVQFHILIGEFTKNVYLMRAQKTYATLMLRFGRFATFIPGHLDAALEDHPKIIEAFVKRNTALAEFLARKHFVTAKKYMSAYMQKLSEGARREEAEAVALRPVSARRGPRIPSNK